MVMTSADLIGRCIKERGRTDARGMGRVYILFIFYIFSVGNMGDIELPKALNTC